MPTYLNLLLLLCLISTIKGRKKCHERNDLTAHNEVIEKVSEKAHLIQVKFPEIEDLHVNKKPSVKKRQFDINVVPIKENCQAKFFKTELLSLRLKVKCEPRDTLVKLIPPVGATIVPDAVIVKRCGGACSSSKTCQSQYKIDTTFYVKTIDSNGISCSTISVPEDTKCKCACHKKPSSCSPNQIYDKKRCDCVCKDEDEYTRCLTNSNKNMRWDKKRCSCVCRQKKMMCTTGTIWVDSQCRCAKIAP